MYRRWAVVDLGGKPQSRIGVLSHEYPMLGTKPVGQSIVRRPVGRERVGVPSTQHWLKDRPNPVAVAFHCGANSDRRDAIGHA